MNKSLLSKRHYNSSQNQQSQGGLIHQGIESYDTHKFAQRLLLEESVMALEQQQRLVDAALLNPEVMLQTNRITGTTNPDENLIPNMLRDQKYDLQKNIILKRNPLIIKEKNVSNKAQLNKEA